MDSFLIDLKYQIARARASKYANKSQLYKVINHDDRGLYSTWSKRERERANNYLIFKAVFQLMQYKNSKLQGGY